MGRGGDVAGNGGSHAYMASPLHVDKLVITGTSAGSDGGSGYGAVNAAKPYMGWPSIKVD